MHRYDYLYEPIPDLQAYLNRLNYQGAVEPTLAVLTQLMRAHLLSVPFEDLDVYHLAKIPELGTAALFDKIVTRRRGGYCFELNLMFFSALKAIGFDVYRVPVRIHRGVERKPMSHCGLVVTIDGKQYYADVGYGGPCPITPVAMDEGEEWQPSGHRLFSIEHQDRRVRILLRETAESEPILLFSFVNEPTEPYDFLALNLSTSAIPTAPFRMMHNVILLTEDGHLSINGNVFVQKHNGTVTETALQSADELQQVLRNHFGIEFDGIDERFLAVKK